MVDDDVDLLSVMKRGLKPHSDKFELLTAENGKEALKTLDRENISLVVTDLMMPIMDGFQLLTQMMEKHPFTPRMIMSSTQAARQQMLEDNSGIEAFLVKPVTPKELGAKILETLEAQENDTGYVKGISLMSFSQLVELEQKSCVLQVTHGESQEKGYLFFRDGQLIDAQVAGTRGTEAAYTALSWKSVNIAIRDDRPDLPDVIRTPMQTLLMEAAYQSDMKMMSDSDRAALSKEMNESDLDQFNAISASAPSSLEELSEGLNELDVSDQTGFFPPPPPSAAGSSSVTAGGQDHSESEPTTSSAPKANDSDTIEFDISNSNLFMVDLPSGDSENTNTGNESHSLDASESDDEEERASEVLVQGDDFGELLDEGFDAFREKNYKLAHTLWRRAQELNPDDKRLKYNLKLVEKKLGES